MTQHYFSGLQPLGGEAQRGKHNLGDRLGQLTEKKEREIAGRELKSISGFDSAPRAPLTPALQGEALLKTRANANTVVFGKGQNAHPAKPGYVASSAPVRQGRWHNAPTVEADALFAVGQLGPADSLGILDAKLSKDLSEVKKEADYSIETLGRYQNERNQFSAVRQTDKDGKPISRRAALQSQLDELVKEMVLADLEVAKRDALVKKHGFQSFNYHE